MRRELGADVALLVDGNSAFGVQRAIEVGHLLQDYRVAHFEEPCPYWELEQTKAVRDALDIDVTGGEQDCFMPVWKQMVSMHAVDILQPDVCYMGGMVRTLRVAKLGARRRLAVHAAQRQPLDGHALHHAPPGRDSQRRQVPRVLHRGRRTTIPGTRSLFVRSPYDVVDGHVTIPSEPGWGVEIDPAWLARATYQCSEA